MNDPLNSFLPNTRDRNWVNRMKERYQNPEEYKKHLREQSNENWEQSKTGGISEEMSVREAQRKRQVEEERRRAEEKRLEEERRKAEEKRLRELGPNFPKVWDLSYKREEPQRIFLRKSDDKLDWDFFKFKVYVNETDYF